MQIINFEFQTEFGLFSDAIVLPDELILSDADIEAEKQNRLSQWLAIVNPPQTDITNG